MSETVLIADSFADRSDRVAAACRARGIAAHRVSHGAAALEFALAKRPAAMLAQHALPLIEGPRLAEILLANPHTRDMRVLILDDAVEQGEGDAQGRVVPGAADPETIAHFLGALLERRSRQQGPLPDGASPAIEGNLAQLALGELIELFHVNRKSGTIELRQDGGHDADRGEIHLHEGDVVHAAVGEVVGEKALFRLLRWRRGHFAFREGDSDVPRGIERATGTLLREAERHAKEFARLGDDLPSERDRVFLKVPRSSLPNLLHPVTQEVLLVLELSDRVGEVVDRCSHPDFQVLRTLQTLVRRGMVEIASESAGGERARAGLFAPAVAARLRDWLDRGRPRDAQPVDAKLPVWYATTEGLAALTEQLGRLPGVQVRRAAGGGVQARVRVPLDHEVAIEVLAVPCQPRYAPIWPLCTHGALAGLFVHTGSLEQSVEALRPAIEVTQRDPRFRVFHLLIGDKSEARAEALGERLGLLDDERSVLALSVDRPDVAGGALRELLARLLP